MRFALLSLNWLHDVFTGVTYRLYGSISTTLTVLEITAPYTSCKIASIERM